MKKKSADSDTPLVYSSEHGRICPGCGQPAAACRCRQTGKAPKAPAGDGIVRVGRETKGRKGKGVTLVSGAPLPPADLKQLAQKLKKACGTGGSVKNGVIEIQGDHREKVMDLLKDAGWRVKRSGG